MSLDRITLIFDLYSEPGKHGRGEEKYGADVEKQTHNQELRMRVMNELDNNQGRADCRLR